MVDRIIDSTDILTANGATAAQLTSHTGDTANPHATTAAQVGAQASNSNLSALAGLTLAANKLPYATGPTTMGVTDLSAYIRTLLDDADAATARGTLGAQASSTNLTALAGITLVTDALAYGTGTTTMGTTSLSSFMRTVLDDANAAAARTTLGAEAAITAGTSVQLIAGDKTLVNQADLPISTLVQTELDTLQAEIDAITAGAEPGVVVCTGVGDGVTDDTATINTMFSTVAHGGTAQLVRGKTYYCASTIAVNCNSKSIVFDGNGAEIVFSNTSHRMLFQTAFVNVQTMTSMASDGYSVVVSDASVYRLKDYVRLYSNDNTATGPYGSYNATHYRAEDMLLELVDTATDTLYFNRPSLSKIGGGLLAAYTTSPKVAQRSGHTITIKDLNVRCTDSPTLANFQLRGMVELEGFMRPILTNVSCRRGFMATALLRACMNGLIIGGYSGWHDDKNVIATSGTPDARNHPGDAIGPDSNGYYGYGILDTSTGTVIIGHNSYRVRHAIDTAQQYGLGSTPQYYGGSVGLRVISCRADFTTEDAYSCHHGAIDAMYIGCTASNAGNPMNNTGYAFGLRGECTLINCTAYNCFGSYHVFDEGAASPARNRVVIRGFRSIDSGRGVNSNHITPVDLYNTEFINMTTTNPAAFSANYTDSLTRFHGTTLMKFTLLSASNPVLGQSQPGVIEFDRLVLDFYDCVNQTSSYIWDIRGNGATTFNGLWRANMVYIRGAAPSTMFKYTSANLPDTDQIRMRICCEDSVLTYSGSAQNNTTNIQLCGSNNLSSMGDATIVNSIDRFKGNERTETLTGLNFGASVADLAEASVTATVNGFKSGDLVTWRAACANEAVEVVRVGISADNTAKIFVRNISGSAADFSSLTIKLALVR